MSPHETPTAPTPHRRRRLLALLILALIVTPLAVWLYPSKLDRMSTLDGEQQWPIATAPPRRQVIWSPAKIATPPPLPENGSGNIVQPHFSPDGLTLYFSLRDASQRLNLYQSENHNGTWQEAQLLTDLNSPADDTGPILSADGQTLYFSSDREGGHGGFDLYQTVRTPQGWAKPENLGKPINSIADECEPAPSPEGYSLYYTSNHSPNMQSEADSPAGDRKTARWTSTLRAAVGLNQYNLYRARRKKLDEPWQEAKPLSSLNRSDANDGSPCVDPTGSFLYFASDRPHRPGEPKNLDLYRSRIRQRGHDSPENLGQGINTKGHELEPYLGQQSFQIFFSRTAAKTADAPSSKYDLYISTAVEVEVQEGRDFSRLSSLATFFQRILRTTGDFFRLHWWWMALLLLVAALVASLAWYLRHVSVRRASVPVFFVWAVVIHLLLGAGSFYIYFDAELMQTVKETFKSVLVASKRANDDLHQSHKPGQEAYEKVADLKAVETVETSDILRQVTETPNVAVATDSAIPQLPSRTTVTLEAVPRLQVEAIVAEPRQTVKPLDRRQIAADSPQLPPVTLEAPPVAPQQPKELLLPKAEPTLVRQPAAQPKLPQDAIASLPAPAKVSVIENEPDRSRPEAPQTPEAEPTPEKLQRQQPSPANEPTPSQVVRLDLPPVATPTDTPSPQPSISLKTPRNDTSLIPSPTVPDVAAQPTRSTVRPDASRPLDRQIQAPLDPETVISQASYQVATLLQKASPPAPPATAAQTPAPLLASPSQQTAPKLDLPIPSQTVASVRQQDPSPLSLKSEPSPAKTKAVSAPQALKRTPNLAQPATTQPTPSLSELTRTESDAATAAPDTVAALTLPAREETTRPVPLDVASPPLATPRLTAPPIGLPANSATKVSGPVRPTQTPLVIGSVGAERIDALVTTSPHATALLRRNARAPDTLYAEDNIGLQALLRLRKIDLAAKEELIKLFGGSEKTLESINLGLAWIAQQQHEDGRWSLHELRDIDGKKPTKAGGVKSDAAATGFALLPLLGNGNTHQAGAYKENVQRGLQWLTKQQQKNGELSIPKPANSRMYSHGVATIALCEAYAMTNDASLKDPAQRALDFIVAAQHKQLGGWRYNPGDSPDTSVVGWQVMALKSGLMANLKVPPETLLGARKWLDRVGGKGNNLGQFGYMNPTDLKPEMSAEGLLCLQYLDVSRDDPVLQAGASYLAKTLPRKNTHSSYYWYYGSQFMYHMQGDPWKKWNDAMKPILIDSQISAGHEAGTWAPTDNWEKSGGRLLSTSLRILILEVYFRHLPLYQITE